MKALNGFKKLILTSVLTLLPFIAVAGGSAGGGGLTYKLPNGKVVTLPEFGILLQDKVTPTYPSGKVYPRQPKYYDIPYDVYLEVQRIIQKAKSIIPSFSLKVSVSPDKKKMISKLDVDRGTYEQVKKEYRTVLDAFGYTLDDEQSFLPAYSENGITYILPEFEKLTTTQKAKILIHEAHMREDSSMYSRLGTLEKVLKIDTLIQQLISVKQVDTTTSFEFLKRMAKLKLIDKEDIFHHILLMMLGELNNEIYLLHFIEEPYTPAWGSVLKDEFQLDPSFIQELQIERKLKHNYAEMFEGTIIRFARPWSSFTTSKSIINLFCSNKENLKEYRERIVPDPDSASNQNIIAKKAYLIKCTGGWSPTAEILWIDVKTAGPFIEALVKGE